MSNAMRRCLEEGDVDGACKLWGHIAPHLPQPRTEAEAMMMFHHARTQAESIAFRLRAYSHAWLCERGLSSGLPDHLRPQAERIYPRIVEAVGVAVKAPPHRRELGNAIQSAMSSAVLEAYADGRKEPEFVKARMLEARARVLGQ